MAVKDKKILSLVEENDLLKEQVNIQKELNKLLEENQKTNFKIGNSIAKSVKDLAITTDLDKQINDASSVRKSLQKEIKDLQSRDVGVGKLIYLFRNNGNKLLRNQFELQRKQLRSEIERLKIMTAQTEQIGKNAKLLKETFLNTENLKRKAAVADALGLSKYTSGITNAFSRVALLLQKFPALSNTILATLNKWYYPIIIVYATLSKIFEIFKEMDKSFFGFRKQWGLLRPQSKEFEDRLYRITKNTAQLGVKFDDAVEAMTKLGKESGSLLNISDEMITNVVVLNKQLGISTDISVRFLKTLASVSQQTIDSQSGMLGLAQAMSSAAKVPLNDVMEDVAKASASSYAYISREPLQLIKAAVEARRLGSSLSSLATSSKSLLSFTESIESEMEASVLTGRAINLQLARQLAYNKNFIGLNKEIVKLAKEFNYNQMDPFQAQAFAKALGKSEEELAKIVQSSEEATALQNRANELARAGNRTLLDQLNKRNAMLKASEEELKNLGKRAEKNFQTIRNQERLTAITDQWRQIWIEASEYLIPFINGILKGISFMMPLVKWGIYLVSTLSGLKLIIGSINFGLGLMGSKLKVATVISNTFSKIVARFSSLTTKSGSLLGGITKTLGEVAKFASRIVIPLVFAYNIFLQIKKILNDPVLMGTRGFFAFNGKLILRALGAIGKALWDTFNFLSFGLLNGVSSVIERIYNALGKPFERVWNWLKNTFLGSSPSQLGLMIVEGLKSVGGMLFNSITEPFKKAWEWISSLFGKSSIQSNIKTSIVSAKAAKLGVPVDNLISGKEIKSYRELEKTPMTETEKKEKETQTSVNEQQAMMEYMAALLTEMKGIRNDFATGRIAVNLDGQLVSTNMNRGNKFRGNYGAMQG